MIFVVYESKYNCITSVAKEIIARFPREAVYSVYDRKIAEEAFSMLLQKPLLFKAWLVVYEVSKVDTAQLKRLAKTNNLILFRPETRAELNSVLEAIGDLPYEIRYNNKVDKDSVVAWISTELKCTNEAAKVVYSRCNGYLPSISASVDALRSAGDVTVELARRYVARQSRVRSFNVVEYLLVGAQCGYSYREIVKYLSEYRYAFVWLKGVIVSTLDLYEKVFLLEIEGSLSLQNCKAFLQMCEDKSLRDVPEYRVCKILECHEKVSLEYVYYVNNLIKSIPDKNFGIYKLIGLLRTV